MNVHSNSMNRHIPEYCKCNMISLSILELTALIQTHQQYLHPYHKRMVNTTFYRISKPNIKRPSNMNEQPSHQTYRGKMFEGLYLEHNIENLKHKAQPMIETNKVEIEHTQTSIASQKVISTNKKYSNIHIVGNMKKVQDTNSHT